MVNKTKKNYLTPSVKVVEMGCADIICTSTKGTFNAQRNIEKGSDSDWGEDLDW